MKELFFRVLKEGVHARTCGQFSNALNEAEKKETLLLLIGSGFAVEEEATSSACLPGMVHHLQHHHHYQAILMELLCTGETATTLYQPCGH